MRFPSDMFPGIYCKRPSLHVILLAAFCGGSSMNICVFGASSDRIDSSYLEAAEKLGTLIARCGHRLVFGGGREGLMGACARGVLCEGGKALGIAPRFFDEPGVLMKEPACEILFTDTMSERKCLMEEKADAFIALPGGIGTYEEFFEVLTLKQLGRHSKPMAMLNTLGYYNIFNELLRQTAKQGFMRDDVLSLYAMCKDPEAVMDHILHCKTAPQTPRSLSNYSK